MTVTRPGPGRPTRRPRGHKDRRVPDAARTADHLPDPPRGLPRRNLIAFALLATVSVIGALVVFATVRDPRTATRPGDPTAVAAGDPVDVAAIRSRPHITFRSTEVGPSYGSLALAPMDTLADPPDGDGATTSVATTDLQCERVAEAADRGICLVADRGVVTTYQAVVFDERYQPLFTTDLPGSPSRTRVSPDGRIGSLTVFVTGHSYAEVGFSTYTELLDLRTGRSFGDLEQFQLWRDGELVDAVDRNFWGVTFTADPNRFYATASTGGATYLVEGDLEQRTLTTVRGDVECPSLSPDGSRIAFKQRSVGAFGQVEWHLAVLDLATGSVVTTAEARPIDDQPEWLDDQTILYGLDRGEEMLATTDVWAVAADGSGAPRQVLAGAWSPSVVREPATGPVSG